MADSVKQPDIAEPAVVTPVVPVQTAKVWQRLPVWGWVVGAIVLFFAIVGVMAAGFSMFHHGSNRLTVTSSAGMMRGGFDDEQFSVGTRRGGFGDRMMGSMGTVNSDTRVAGVVTAVDGNTLTVAGNGTATKVVVSDSTTYAGSSKPATVNDSIIAIGTKASDGTFTATTVQLTR